MAIATLPVVLAVVLTELAVGGAFVSWFVDRAGRAPSGPGASRTACGMC